MINCDVAIVGAGIAGASLAAELAPHLAVVVLEAESLPGMHATGRSAAFWSETYGGPFVQPLTSASGPWLNEHGFLSPRGELNIGVAKDQPLMDDFANAFGASVTMERLDRGDIENFCDFIRPEWDRAIAVPSCQDIDVAALHQAYLTAMRKAGGLLTCNAQVNSAVRAGGQWLIETAAGRINADVLVNAAGAWADDIAHRAGTKPLGIEPMRRTMLQVRLDRPVPPELPLVIDIKGGFYFKGDVGGQLWLSPHDETPSEAVDAVPNELDVAIAIDRFERASMARVLTVTRKWAGLRSFAPDRLPVYGFDRGQPGFFWCAGQGGFGIQTAPAAAKLAARLILGKSPDSMIADIDSARYAPSRFT
jgi:D-arginine dehydrogenase